MARRRVKPARPSITAALTLTLLLLTSLVFVAPAEETDDEPFIDNIDPLSSNANATPNTNTNNDPALTADSVILITGAAGFIGSELALALIRTYSPKKLLLVDNLGIASENESAYVPPPKDAEEDDRAIYEKLNEETLSLFEIRRQRLFRIFHELTSANEQQQQQQQLPSIQFYRADLRPSIPEFFDFGEVPLLEGIFTQHPDITHVVHLADVPSTPSWDTMAVPRQKDSVKAGMMEGILEELKMVTTRNNQHAVPHFVYASTSEVYDSLYTTTTTTKKNSKVPNPPPFKEHLPITTPSTLRGASKLMEEIMVSAFHSTHKIPSVGLRFFEVYGPWSTPGTEVFDLVEKLAVESDVVVNEDKYDLDVKDYVFIDDAVDAIMSAMQYKSAESVPVVFNVGTGRGTTLKEMGDEVAKIFPNVRNEGSGGGGATNTIVNDENRQPSTSIASTSRSEALLGFKAQTSLEEGLAHTISWHLDRSLPYDRDPSSVPSLERQSLETSISSALDSQRSKCSPLDRECLRGSPIFPCASECKRSERCTPSLWDDVAKLSRAVTSGCDAVLYTIMLDEDAEQIPSATLALVEGGSDTDGGVGVDSSPFVGAGLPTDLGKRTAARCNVAFVSEQSPLVKRLKSEGEEYVEEDVESGLPNLLRHGFWTVLPVRTPPKKDSSAWLHAFAGRYALEYLPKLSPGMFFGSSVRFAAYADPTVVLNNLPKLLKTMDGPNAPSGHRTGSTALLLSTKHPKCDPSVRGSSCQWTRPPKNDSLQASVYNTIRVALRGQLLGGSLDPTLDTSFVIHALRHEDARLFRCDTYTEVAQWGASGDERSVEFMISLHDIWSKAVTHWNGQEAWWVQNEAKEGDSDNGTYMGILSSSDNQLVTQIVSSERFGITHLE